MSCIYSHEDGAYCDKHSHGAATLSCSGEEDCPDRIVKTNADVTPVRHGRWKLEENWETGYGVYVHVCTACNAITPVNVSRYKYCPNCGAKMDGGET